MAQLDVLLSAIVTHKAQELRVEGGSPAALQVAGTSKTVTRGPLTNE